MISTRQKEITKLKNKLPQQASQQVRDLSALAGALAELEEKGEIEEQRLKDKYDKLLEKRNLMVSEGRKDHDDLKADMEKKLKEIIDNAKKRAEQAEKDIVAGRSELESFQTDLQAQKLKIKAAGPMAASQAPQLALAGGVEVDVAPGILFHSNLIQPEAVKTHLQSFPGLEGISNGQSAATTNAFLAYLKTIGMTVAPVEAPAASSHAAVSHQQGVAGSTTTGALHQNDLTLDKDQVEQVMGEADQWTDEETDTEEDTSTANGNAKKTKKKISKADKKKKAAAAKAKAADNKNVGNVD